MNHIHPTAIIDSRVVLGDNISIGAFTTIGFAPEHKTFTNNPGRVYIGNNTVIRECVTIHASMKQAGTHIGKDCFIMSHAHIGHDSFIGEGAVISAGAVLAGFVTVGDASYIGINASLHQYAEFPSLSILGAGAFFKGRDKLSGLKWVGVPARPIAVNAISIRKHMTEDEAEDMIKELSGLFR